MLYLISHLNFLSTGVTPNENVTQPTIGVVVVIFCVVVILIGVVATLLVCWFRRRSSQLRTARSTAEPEHQSNPRAERSFVEPNNQYPQEIEDPLKNLKIELQ